MMKKMARWIRENGAIIAVATALSAIGGPGVRDAVSVIATAATTLAALPTVEE